MYSSSSLKARATNSHSKIKLWIASYTLEIKPSTLESAIPFGLSILHCARQDKTRLELSGGTSDVAGKEVKLIALRLGDTMEWSLVPEWLGRLGAGGVNVKENGEESRISKKEAEMY